MLLSRYRPILSIQYFLLLVDLCANAFSEMLRSRHMMLMVAYVIQDICVIMAIIIVFLMLFNTFTFQAGFISFLVNQFRVPVLVSLVYFGLCAAITVLALLLFDQGKKRWDEVEDNLWDVTHYRVLYVIQRTWALLYYFFYMRTALKLSDPRFYRESDWMRAEIEKRR